MVDPGLVMSGGRVGGKNLRMLAAYELLTTMHFTNAFMYIHAGNRKKMHTNFVEVQSFARTLPLIRE